MGQMVFVQCINLTCNPETEIPVHRSVPEARFPRIPVGSRCIFCHLYFHMLSATPFEKKGLAINERILNSVLSGDGQLDHMPVWECRPMPMDKTASRQGLPCVERVPGSGRLSCIAGCKS